jgi:prepilin-type N-terminal cleavage/methylation domain-containing protein
MKKQGFTLVELLIVVAIILILAILIFVNFRNQIAKANDAKRKSDLVRIQRSLEEHYNDQRAYPPQPIFSDCGGTAMQPYLREIPCDPVGKTPYLYVPDAVNLRKGYRICAKLENMSDPDIIAIGCNPTTGCGWEVGYNYCLANGVSVTPAGFNPGSATYTPTPTNATPTPEPGQYACTPQGDCNSYQYPEQKGCPWTYQDPGCVWQGVDQCTKQANRCTQ